MKEQLLEIESDNLTKALNGITFQVMTGEFLGIMGSSGSGKSTLLNCIATVIRPSGGRISMQGTDIHSLSGARLAEYRGKKIGSPAAEICCRPGHHRQILLCARGRRGRRARSRGSRKRIP